MGHSVIAVVTCERLEGRCGLLLMCRVEKEVVAAGIRIGLSLVLGQDDVVVVVR